MHLTSVHLTPTQIKVMRGVHSGQLNKQIAYELGIAEATVKAHMTALMRKLKVHDLVGLVKFAIERNLTSTSQAP